MLAELAETDAAEVNVSTVGPSWGKEITHGRARPGGVPVAILLLPVASGSSGRWRSAPSLAMVHDVIISVGRVLGLPVRGHARRR